MREITALAPWFGGNRLLGAEVGRLLGACEWVGVPFMGGGPELRYIRCRTGAANDLHRGVINLATTAADARLGPRLWRGLRRLPFHPDTLAAAQVRCRARVAVGRPHRDEMPDPDFAADYFVCAWMGRSGKGGKADEFRGGPAFRWEAGGGDSVVRFRNAAAGLRDWRAVLARWAFDCRDAFEFLAKCQDRAGHGLYCDPPWPDDGDCYAHAFTEDQQRRLATTLAGYRVARVVVRFGDHPLVRALYPEHDWTWHHLAGRTAANKAKAEVLLTNFAQ